ncbi:hypothetical protein ACFV5N_00900 [Streptomyces sp. NPDC059853]|uniref:hypothetical protein n=1 Tax=Streptomyces sp. NPDC059853 TaxID=3346973 RepID=UPI003651AEC3
MASIETDFIIDGDEGYDPDSAPTVPVRVDGKVYTAHRPKDSVQLLLEDLQAQATDTRQYREILHQLLLAMFDEDDAEALLAQIMDPSNRKVGILYMLDLFRKVVAHFKDELGFELEIEEQAQNREGRRAAVKKAAAKKTSTRKAPAKKTAAA